MCSPSIQMSLRLPHKMSLTGSTRSSPGARCLRARRMNVHMISYEHLCKRASRRRSLEENGDTREASRAGGYKRHNRLFFAFPSSSHSFPHPAIPFGCAGSPPSSRTCRTTAGRHPALGEIFCNRQTAPRACGALPVFRFFVIIGAAASDGAQVCPPSSRTCGTTASNNSPPACAGCGPSSFEGDFLTFSSLEIACVFVSEMRVILRSKKISKTVAA